MPRITFNRLIIDTKQRSQPEIVSWLSQHALTDSHQTPPPGTNWRRTQLTVFVRRDKVELVTQRYVVLRNEPVTFHRQTTPLSQYTARELEIFYAREQMHRRGVVAEQPYRSQSLVSAYYFVRNALHRLALIDDKEQRRKEGMRVAALMQAFAGDPPHTCTRAQDPCHYCVGPGEEDGIALIHRAGKVVASLKSP